MYIFLLLIAAKTVAPLQQMLNQIDEVMMIRVTARLWFVPFVRLSQGPRRVSRVLRSICVSSCVHDSYVHI